HPAETGSPGRAGVSIPVQDALSVPERDGAVARFDLDHPEVGVARHGPPDSLVGLALRNSRFLVRWIPDEPAVEIAHLRQQAAAGSILIELQHDRAAHPLALVDHHDPDTRGGAAPELRIDPDMRRQPPVRHRAFGLTYPFVIAGLDPAIHGSATSLCCNAGWTPGQARGQRLSL